MGRKKQPPESVQHSDGGDHHHGHEHEQSNVSRRDLLQSAAVGAAVGVMAAAGMPSSALSGNRDKDKKKKEKERERDRDRDRDRDRNRRILLKGGVVLTMDPNGGDLAKGDVLIEGSKIKAIGPNLGSGGGEVIDCSGMIVMPGFIDTHHHQYETIQRSIIADGNLAYAGVAPQFPEEGYGTIVQSVWTTGRIGTAQDPVWDIGRSPYDPEDNYISELVASITGIDQGVTTGIDTSQSSHSPEHTDAMIQGIMDSGRRTLYAYGSGRSDTPGYEFPGAIGDETTGLGRLRKEWFSSDDQLVTLGHTGGPPDGWLLARAFSAVIVNHNNSNGQNMIDNQNLLEQFANEGFPVEQIHCARFMPEAYDVCAQYGVHISIAGPIEMQMGHGMPPYQACLKRGILPSLSADVDTNMSPDMFTLMRSAFTTQRALLHQRALPPDLRGETEVGGAVQPGEVLLTSYQVLQMATWAGAAAAGLGSKVGRLVPGLEADIIVLRARSLNTWPVNNAPGTIVTMMDTSHVDTVIIGGKIKKRAGKLIGVNVDKLLRDIERSRERVLSRINGPAVGSNPNAVHQFLNSEGNPYRPAFLRSCCVAPIMNVGIYDATPGTGSGV